MDIIFCVNPMSESPIDPNSSEIMEFYKRVYILTNDIFIPTRRFMFFGACICLSVCLISSVSQSLVLFKIQVYCCLFSY